MTENQEPANRVSAWLAKGEVGLAALSWVAILVIMLLVVTDVVMRYVLAAPLSWSYDLIGLYLMVAVFFFALPDTLNQHGHIAIDLFQHALPFALGQLALAVGYLASSAVIGLIGWEATLRFLTAYAHDDRLAAIVPWPTWVSYFIVLVGCYLLTLRCLYRTVGHLLSAAAGRLLVEMPLPPMTDESEGDGL